jgi:protein phosphatase
MADKPSEQHVASLPFRWGAASDVGKVRQENQDVFLVEPEVGLFLVCDGMGGHRGGTIAAKTIADDLPPVIENKLDMLRARSPRAIRSLLRQTLAEQSRQLQMEGTSENGYKDMGATVVVALLQSGRAYIANLGDSRAYRYRAGQLRQITKDHSVVSELLAEGQIKPDEAENHATQGQITRYVGMEEKAHPHVRSFGLKKGDRLLLCTDGLTDLIEDRQIAGVLQGSCDCQAACKSLVEAADAAGGTDNVTVVIVDWLGRRQE